MCFSASASFSASAFLAFVGILTINLSKRRELRLLSFLPIIFALHQFIEGILWYAIPAGAELVVTVFSYLYLFVAVAFWPAYILWAIPITIESRIRQCIIDVLRNVGILWAIVASVFLLAFVPSATILDGHIYYQWNAPTKWLANSLLFWISSSTVNRLLAGIYGLLVVGPFFLIRNRRLKLFGVMLAGSGLLTALYRMVNFISIWCFFAAVLSVYVYLLIWNDHV